MSETFARLANPYERGRLRTDLPFDRFMRSVLSYLPLALSAVLLAQGYFGSNLTCQPPKTGGTDELMKYVDHFCWANLHTGSTGIGTSKQYSALPQKIFPVVYASQAVLMLIPVFLWALVKAPMVLAFLKHFVVFSNDMSLHLSRLYGRSSEGCGGDKGDPIYTNISTNGDATGGSQLTDTVLVTAGKSKGVSPSDNLSYSRVLIMESIVLLSQDLGDFLRHWLNKRARGIVWWYVAKHWTCAGICLLYIIIFCAGLPLNSMWESQVTCSPYVGGKYTCTIVNAHFQAIIWIINIIILVVSCLASIAYGIYILWEINVEDSFFFKNIPGLSNEVFVKKIQQDPDPESGVDFPYVEWQNGRVQRRQGRRLGLKLLSELLYHNEANFEKFAYMKRTARRTVAEPVWALNGKLSASLQGFWKGYNEQPVAGEQCFSFQNRRFQNRETNVDGSEYNPYGN